MSFLSYIYVFCTSFGYPSVSFWTSQEAKIFYDTFSYKYKLLLFFSLPRIHCKSIVNEVVKESDVIVRWYMDGLRTFERFVSLIVDSVNWVCFVKNEAICPYLYENQTRICRYPSVHQCSVTLVKSSIDLRL